MSYEKQPKNIFVKSPGMEVAILQKGKNKDLPSNLPDKPPKAKSVKVMKVEKQSDGTFLCLLCFNFFDDLSDVHKHVPFCVKSKIADEALKLKNLETFTCSACDLLFDSQRKIDKHYRDPKCLNVQKLIVEETAKINSNQS